MIKNKKKKFLPTPWEMCLNRKITMTIVKAFRKMIADGVKLTKIANYFDVSVPTVRRWSSKKNLENSRSAELKYNREKRVLDYDMISIYNTRAVKRKASIMPEIIAYHATGKPIEG